MSKKDEINVAYIAEDTLLGFNFETLDDVRIEIEEPSAIEIIEARVMHGQMTVEYANYEGGFSFGSNSGAEIVIDESDLNELIEIAIRAALEEVEDEDEDEDEDTLTDKFSLIHLAAVGQAISAALKDTVILKSNPVSHRIEYVEHHEIAQEVLVDLAGDDIPVPTETETDAE